MVSIVHSLILMQAPRYSRRRETAGANGALELTESVFKLFFDTVQVRNEVTTGVLDGLRRLFLPSSLTLDFDPVLQRVRPAVPRKFDRAIA